MGKAKHTPKPGVWSRVRQKFTFFKVNYPKTWMLLKHLVLPAAFGGIVVGAIMLSGGSASVPFFAAMVAKIGLPGFYAVLGGVSGLCASWLGHVVADVTRNRKLKLKLTLSSPPLDVKIDMGLLSKKESELKTPPLKAIHEQRMALAQGPALLQGLSTAASVYPALLPAEVPELTTGPIQLYPQSDEKKAAYDADVAKEINRLADRVVFLLETQSERLRARLSPEALDAAEFVKKYSGESDLAGTLARHASLFSNPDASYDMVLNEYQAFRRFVKSQPAQEVLHQKELESSKRQDILAKKERDKDDERRAKMGLSLHPLDE